MSHRFLVIPRMRIQHANAMQAWWLMAPPSPMTLYGFSRAMGLQCKFQSSSLAMTLHSVQWLGAEKSNARFVKKHEDEQDNKDWVRFWHSKFLPQQQQGATFIDKQDHSGSGFAKSLQPTARCHVEMSVVIDIGDDGVHLDDVGDFLWSCRLGGGALVDHGAVKICRSQEEIAQKIGGGFWVADRSERVTDVMENSGVDGTEALIQVLATNAKPVYQNSAKQEESTNKPESWLSANVVGYAALESPTERSGVRNGAPHAYAEPLVGLVQYLSVRKSERTPFWQYHAIPEKGVYLMKGN